MGNKVYPPEIKVEVNAPVTTSQEPPDHHKESVKQSPTWTILTRLHAGYFSISISLGAQALLWKTLIKHNTNDSLALHRMFYTVPSIAFVLLWWVALCTLTTLFLLYVLRCIFHFHMVKAEFFHDVRVNYLISPWISWLLLLHSSPFINPNSVFYQVLCGLFVVPVVGLNVKINGQWLTTRKRFLSIAANPTSQISVIGNSVGAWAAAKMGWKESAICIFTLGLAHYLVVFITLYQRLSGSGHIPAKLHPVFFLFVASPSVVGLAWNSISGTFNTPCKMFFFLSLFLFTSLACRPALFKKSMRRFNVAWWDYSFPLTFLALASTEYAQEVKDIIALRLMLVLSALSVLVFLLMVAALKTLTSLGAKNLSV